MSTPAAAAERRAWALAWGALLGLYAAVAVVWPEAFLAVVQTVLTIAGRFAEALAWVVLPVVFVAAVLAVLCAAMRAER